MKIEWFGHAFFKLIDSRGISIATDPFDSSLGYKVPTIKADIVSISHNHFDHSNTDAIIDGFEFINKEGNFSIKGINIKGIKSYHDDVEGKVRGENIIYKYRLDNLNICHLGDLGHALNENQIQEIGSIDILLIPIGGNYTIDSKAAVKVVNQINPKMIIPMHYKTPVLNFELQSVSDFTKKLGGENICFNYINIDSNIHNMNKKVIVLNYE